MSKKLTHQFLCSKMMLPEHCSKLREYTAKNQWEEDHRRPDLDEQFQEEMQQVFEQALAGQTAVEITTLTNSGYRFYRGIPLRIDQAYGLVYLRDKEGKLIKIPSREAIGVNPA